MTATVAASLHFFCFHQLYRMLLIRFMRVYVTVTINRIVNQFYMWMF